MRLSPKEDYLNKNKTRNQDNTYQSEYNCGGYALRTFSWFYPDDAGTGFDWAEREDIIRDMICDGYDRYEMYDVILKRDVKYMLDVIPTLSVYNGHPKFYEPKEGEELIAYRIFINDEEEDDNDFHFMVLRDGCWKEKCGSGVVKFCLPPWEDRNWVYPSIEYDSEIVYFVNKVGEN